MVEKKFFDKDKDGKVEPEEIIDTVWDYIKRHTVLVIIMALALLFVIPGLAEYRTIAMTVAFSCIAIFMSGVAQYAYTKMKFVHSDNKIVLGYIFLGICILIGFVVLGVYIAQAPSVNEILPKYYSDYYPDKLIDTAGSHAGRTMWLD